MYVTRVLFPALCELEDVDVKREIARAEPTPFLVTLIRRTTGKRYSNIVQVLIESTIGSLYDEHF